MTRQNLILRAADAASADDAARIIQDALGATDGGIAGYCLSHVEDDWELVHRKERILLLTTYVQMELNDVVTEAGRALKIPS